LDKVDCEHFAAVILQAVVNKMEAVADRITQTLSAPVGQAGEQAIVEAVVSAVSAFQAERCPSKFSASASDLVTTMAPLSNRGPVPIVEAHVPVGWHGM
jgi:hypothetical protein